MTEFTRPIEIDRIPRGGSHEKVEADAAECLVVKSILKVPDVHAVKALLNLTPMHGGGIKVRGEVTVELTLESVISLEAFRTTETYPVERYFVKRIDDPDDELDADVLQGRTIDLAAIVVETIGLELEPYPRKPGESFESAEPEAPEPARVTPFAQLGKLKDKP